MKNYLIQKRLFLTGMVYLLILASFFFMSCSTGTHKTIPITDSWPVVQELSFPEELQVSDTFLLKDTEDPKEIILFAILLFNKGKFEEAKKYFIKAGNNFSSLDAKFEKATFSAAMLSTLKAGNVAEFNRMERFFEEKLLSPEERIKPPLEFVSLIALGRYSRDKLEGFPIGTSSSIQELLKESPKRSLQ